MVIVILDRCFGGPLIYSVYARDAENKLDDDPNGCESLNSPVFIYFFLI